MIYRRKKTSGIRDVVSGERHFRIPLTGSLRKVILILTTCSGSH